MDYQQHEIAYAATSLLGAFSALDLASLLVMNNDAPSFGSPAYATQVSYRMNAQSMACRPQGYELTEHDPDPYRLNIIIQAIMTYQVVYQCTHQGTELPVWMESFVLHVPSGGYVINSQLSVHGLEQWEEVDPAAVLAAGDWQGYLSTCRTCDPHYDRIVHIVGVNQEAVWVKNSLKGRSCRKNI